MPPKAPKKKPAQIVAEAMQEWQAKEDSWNRERIVLQHSINSAMRYLDKVTTEKDAVAAAIDQEAAERDARSAHSAARAQRTREESEKVFARLKDLQHHRQKVADAVNQLHAEKHTRQLEATLKAAEIDRVVHSVRADDLLLTELRLELLRSRLLALRRAEATCAAAWRDVARAGACESLQSFLSSSGTTVFLGHPRLGAGGQYLRLGILNAAGGDGSAPRAKYVHILGTADTVPVALASSGSHRLSDSVVEYCPSRERVTELAAGEAVSPHVAGILRSMWDTRAPGRLLVVSGKLVSQTGGLLDVRLSQAGTPVTVGIADLVGGCVASECTLVVDALASSERGAHGCSLVYVPGRRARVYRHRQQLSDAAHPPSPTDGPLTFFTGLVMDMAAALGQAPSAAESPVELGDRMSGESFLAALDLLTLASLGSRFLQELRQPDEWPSWAAGLPTAIDDELELDERCAALSPRGKKLASACGASVGADVAYAARAAVSEWALRPSRFELVAIVSAPASIEHVDEEYDRMLQRVWNAGPLRLLGRHIDDRKVSAVRSRATGSRVVMSSPTWGAVIAAIAQTELTLVPSLLSITSVTVAAC
jgi:hypothetical protein